jgi:anti-sigma regulatory factor (Ser/Thr protein kinase)
VATVELRFSALPAHVRTARLVAAAVARRSGVDEAVLDEVRLAVGEACSRAVHLHRQHCPDVPVSVTLVDDERAFSVAVTDEAPQRQSDDEGQGALAELAAAADVNADVDRDAVLPEVGLAVISGLVEDMAVEAGREGGVIVRMSWPTTD